MHDAVDRLVTDWSATAPHLDLSPVTVVNRVLRLAPHVERAMAVTLEQHRLTLPEFSLLSVLRRAGPPFQVAQRDLPNRLGLTAATVSIRVDALAGAGLVDRHAASSGRAQIVELTSEGRRRMDAAVDDHLATERALLAPLADGDRVLLARLLRRLLVEHESPDEVTLPAGCTVAGTRATADRLAAVGQDPPETGLLVIAVDRGTPAEGTLRRGDVLIAIDDTPVRGLVDLTTLEALTSPRPVMCDVLRSGQRRGLALSW